MLLCPNGSKTGLNWISNVGNRRKELTVQIYTLCTHYFRHFLTLFCPSSRIQYGSDEGRHSIWDFVELRPKLGRWWGLQHLLLYAAVWRPAMVAGKSLLKYFYRFGQVLRKYSIWDFVELRPKLGRWWRLQHLLLYPAVGCPEMVAGKSLLKYFYRFGQILWKFMTLVIKINPADPSVQYTIDRHTGGQSTDVPGYVWRTTGGTIGGYPPSNRPGLQETSFCIQQSLSTHSTLKVGLLPLSCWIAPSPPGQ